jgi:hypothetical protein
VVANSTETISDSEYLDVFISSRRADGARIARWLKRKIEKFHLRKGLADISLNGAPLTFGGYFRALRSWSIWPVYGGLICANLVAAHYGWLDVLAAVPAPAKP